MTALGTAASSGERERARFRGCIVGLAVGDALGHPTEFVPSIDAIRARWGPAGVRRFEPTEAHPAGTFTDDTQMSIAAARALVRAGHAGLDRLMEILAIEFVAWARSPENDRAPGASCMAGCQALLDGVPWREAGVATSKGCGAAMRAAPFGLYFSDDPHGLVRTAAAQSALTHRHPTALASSVAVAAAVAFASRVDADEPQWGAGLVAFVRAHVEPLNRAGDVLWQQVGAESLLARRLGASEMLQALDRLEKAAGREADDVCALLGGGWVGEEAAAAGIWCTLRADDFSDAVLRGANSSGDSDSIASIAGAIAGARWGVHAIEPSWATAVEKADLLDRLAVALHEAKHGADCPRTGPALDPYSAESKPA